ncbi:MAG: Uma2 family endonuclease, partial [Armatimonadota bacterium]|nr:Uma2 family endonuclease [Armatimonadota bacterium]
GAVLREFVRQRGLGKVVSGEVGFVLSEATVWAADVAFLSQQRLPDGKLPDRFARFAPDLVAEVLSPPDSFSSVLDRVNGWLEAGVRLVWVVDPEGRKVYVCRAGQPVHTLAENDTLSGEDVLPGFRCMVEEIFE